MRGNSHVQFLGEGWPVMAISYPTASLTPCTKKEPRLVRGFFILLRLHYQAVRCSATATSAMPLRYSTR